MKQAAWDKYEAAILIDAYHKVTCGEITKKQAVKDVSTTLRNRALLNGKSISPTFRNENGISMRLSELESIDTNSARGLRNTSKLFREMMKMYRKNRAEFDSILAISRTQIMSTDSSDNSSEDSINDSSILSHISYREGKKYDGYFWDGNKIIDAYPRKKDYRIYVHNRMFVPDNVVSRFGLEPNPNFSETDPFNLSGRLTKKQIIELITSCYENNDSSSNNLSRKKHGALDKKHNLKQSITDLLIEKFKYGCKYASPIELVRFRSYYSEKYNCPLDIDDELLRQKIKDCGFEFEHKIYVLSSQVYHLITETVNTCMNTGIGVIFFEAFYLKNEDYFQNEGVISWKMLSKMILKLFPNTYHNSNCIVLINKRISEISIIESELVRVWGDSILQTVDGLSEKLPYIPYGKIKYVLSYSKMFIWDSLEKYADISKFVISNEQLGFLTEQINAICDSNGRAMLDELDVEEIRAENYELSDVAFYDIICSHLSDNYDINHKVITHKGESALIDDVIIEHCRNKQRCTQSELEEIMKEVTGEIKYPVTINAASSVMVRIDSEHYVSDDQLNFDVDQIDSILDDIVLDGFIGLKEINSFALFPFCGHPWNLFLLESFCRRFSKKYKYMCVTSNKKNAGAIVRKTINLDYHQILVMAVARSNCQLKENMVFDYLIDAGYIIRRNYSNMSELLSEANKNRERSNK